MKRITKYFKQSVASGSTEGAVTLKNAGPRSYRKNMSDVPRGNTRKEWKQDLEVVKSHGRATAGRVSGTPLGKLVYHNRSVGRMSLTSRGAVNYKPSFPKGSGNTFVSPKVSRAIKPIVPKVAAAAGTAGVVSALVSSMDSDTTPKSKSTGNDFKPASFGRAFAHSRKTKGPKATFKWGDKEYSTVTKDDLKKAGGMSLSEYSNKNKLKKSKLKFVTK